MSQAIGVITKLDGQQPTFKEYRPWVFVLQLDEDIVRVVTKVSIPYTSCPVNLADADIATLAIAGVVVLNSARTMANAFVTTIESGCVAQLVETLKLTRSAMI